MAISVEQGFIILEGTTAPVEDWRKALNVDHAAIAALLTQGVFQRSRSADSQSRLRLNMVGLLASQSKAFFCLPKICAGQTLNLPASMRCALTAVQTYHRHIQRGPEASRSGEADIFLGGGSLLDHFLRLWEWTRDFGLHHDEEPVRDDGYRSINWRSTIWNSLPIHQSGSVIYPEPVGEKFIRSLSNLGLIQAYALKCIRSLLGDIADIWSDKYDEIWNQCEDIITDSEIYLDDYITINGILEFYERLCTRDNDKELLELLKGYFESSYRRSSAPMLYGVSSFHVVWEHMCASIFQELGTIEIHSSLASQPSYNLRGNVVELEPQRPDILRSLSQGIIIGDAKWYKVDSDELPRTPDAIKQFFYQNSVFVDKIVIGNFLFLPTLSDVDWVHLGFLSMKSGQKGDDRFPDIQLVGLGWTGMVALYARGGHFTLDFCDWLVEIGTEKIIAPGLADAQPSRDHQTFLHGPAQ